MNNSIHYRCEGNGEGPDVLLIHGWVSSNQMWEQLMNRLKDTARFWAVDLPGFGDSSPYNGDLSIMQHALLLADFCDKHSLKFRVAIGHSMGASVASKLAWLRPDLVERLVLVCPITTGEVGPMGLGGWIMRWLPKFQFARNLLKNGEWVWRIAQNPLLMAIMVSPWGSTENVSQKLTADFQRTHWVAGVHGLYSMTNEDLLTHLPEVQQPSWVIVAGRDGTVPPGDGRLAANLLPNSRLIMYPRAQHHIPEEKPRHFARTIRTILRQYC